MARLEPGQGLFKLLGAELLGVVGGDRLQLPAAAGEVSATTSARWLVQWASGFLGLL